ncbi:uncharacterized protein TNCT_72651 [Trichonephila clavata]|uniref:Uncharacterized protein n=1 Tax=Trichonephila clavata TaxID=2740835 RepID=A0A8X6IW76_TRICU|nr:uncharacterized protein TNCT_72651 [Trichonephila clavata]
MSHRDESRSKVVMDVLNGLHMFYQIESLLKATIFSKLLWNKYEEYQNLYLDIALPLLKEKETSDEDFVALCQLRQGAAKYSLAALLELPVSEFFSNIFHIDQ